MAMEAFTSRGVSVVKIQPDFLEWFYGWGERRENLASPLCHRAYESVGREWRESEGT